MFFPRGEVISDQFHHLMLCSFCKKFKEEQDQIGLERSARSSCLVFCVLCTVGEVA